MTTPTINEVPHEVVEAALRAADRLGRDVADVPLIAIAREAGMSRSTLVRRLNGSRQLLDDAVRAAGVDRKSTRLNSSHLRRSRMPSSA